MCTHATVFFQEVPLARCNIDDQSTNSSSTGNNIQCIGVQRELGFLLFHFGFGFLSVLFLVWFGYFFSLEFQEVQLLKRSTGVAT